MSVEREFRVVCDLCSNWERFTSPRTARGALKRARADGWVRRRVADAAIDGSTSWFFQDWCPECAKRARE